jgi:hypothetical protein
MKMRNFTAEDQLRNELFSYDISAIAALMPPDEDPIWDLDIRRQADPMWGLGATKSIIFKWFVDPDFEWMHSPDIDPFIHKFHEDTELWAATRPLIEQMEQHHNGVAVRAYFSKLNPQSEIDRHADGDCLLVPLVSKNVVSIETNDGDIFESNGIELPLPLGEVYEINNVIEHIGINRGLTRRVLLVVDILPNDFQESIVSGGYGEYPVTNLYANDRTITLTAHPELGRVAVNHRSHWNC